MRRERVLGALALTLLGCHGEKDRTPPPPSVVVEPVVQKDVPVVQEWIGTTDGDVNAQIRPKIDGYLLRRVYVEGSLVHKGDVLFEIDPRQSHAQEQQAAANLDRARAALAKAERDVQRDTPLAEQKAISQQELDDAISAQEAARAAVAAARAALDETRLNLAWSKVASPITGIAGLAAAQVGDLVGPQTLLTTVSAVDPIRVVFKVSEQEYLRIAGAGSGPVAAHVGALQLRLSDGSVFPHPGRLLVESREIDVKTGTLTMIGLVPNPGNRLRPGQYAKVRAQVAVKSGAMVVPQRAVNEMQGAYQVAVVGADNKVEIRPVRAAERIGNLWVIDDGLKPGERVVVEGFARVKAGAVVNPKTAPEASPAAAQR